MRIASRHLWPVVAGLLLAASACDPDDSIPRRLEARLKSALGVERPELSPDEVRQALSRQLRSVAAPAPGAKQRPNPVFPTRETLAEFYARHGNRLAWCDESGEVRPATPRLVEALRDAGEHGLDPEDYGVSRLEDLAAQIGKTPLDDSGVSRLADFDVLATAAFFRYASDLSTGRVHPDEVRDDWHANPPEIDFVALLDRALEGNDLRELLLALPPPDPGYTRLREALQELRKVEEAHGWPVIPDGPKLELGSEGPQVALLRRRLAGPAGAGELHPEPGDRFDETLDGAVRDFQVRHGIEADGKVAARTLAELNVSVERRIDQLELNLERWRWIPRQLGDPHVLVNIPGFDLVFVRGGSPALRSRIVVGKTYTPTPVFSDRIVAVVVNPPWNVPESIAVGEYLPALRKDRTALSKEGLRLLEGSGDDAREVDPKEVDWDDVDEEDFPYRLRQDPGPGSALGRVKFDLTNDFHVYLHDTPADHLFGRTERDLSHGCIRVEKPLELAAEVLGRSSEERLQEALDQTEEQHLSVAPPVPVHILYWTAWVNEDGDLHFGPDVYELDPLQRAALERVASRLGREARPE